MGRRGQQQDSSSKYLHPTDSYLKVQESAGYSAPGRSRWQWIVGLLVFLAGVIAFFNDAFGFWTAIRNMFEPNVSIAFYQEKDGMLQIIPPDRVVVELDVQDIISNRVPVALNLAIHNNEDRPMEVTGVEIAYDRELEVISNGRLKIDPDNNVIIYEHSIPTLQAVESYTPLETIDTLIIPFRFLIVPTVVMSADGVPIQIVSLLGYEGSRFADKTVRMNVRIFVKDRPVVSGIITMTLRANIELISGFPVSHRVEVTPQDLQHVNDLLRNSENLDHWSKRDARGGYVVSFNKVRFENGIYQLVLIDDQLRHVLADQDADGYIDYQLMDTTRDGRCDQKFVIDEPTIMLDWMPEAVE